jgi:hypothetical protein
VNANEQRMDSTNVPVKPKRLTAAEKQAIEVNSAQYRNPYNLAVGVRRQAMRPRGKPYPAVKREYNPNEPF